MGKLIAELRHVHCMTACLIGKVGKGRYARIEGNVMPKLITKCSVCGKGVFDTPGVPLYRNGPIGITDVEWRCIDHVDKKYYPCSSTVEICNIINCS